MSVHIRRAEPTDASAIKRLYRQLVSNPAVKVCPERIGEARLNANTALLVAEQQGTVVGSALLSLCMDVMFKDQPFAVLENVIVDAEVRGRGVGRALMAEVDRIALLSHCSKVMLLSSSGREAAHAFFARAGYLGESKRGFVKYRRSFETSAR